MESEYLISRCYSDLFYPFWGKACFVKASCFKYVQTCDNSTILKCDANSYALPCNNNTSEGAVESVNTIVIPLIEVTKFKKQ